MSVFSSLPVIMYHRVNNVDEGSITISPENFEAQIKYLKEEGYVSVFISDMIEQMKKPGNPPAKWVTITFDDGYLDNWVYAYPILRKYKMTATIFISTFFAKETLPYRPNLLDVINEKAKIEDLPVITPFFDTATKCITTKEGIDDYLTWEEMKRMQESGYIDIQSHSHSHKAFFNDDKIISFNDGTSRKFGHATEGDLRLGIPVYKVAPCLAARRYFDDRALRDHMASYVENAGGKSFFMDKDWKEKLFKEAGNYVEKNGKLNGYFETEEEQENRIKKELILSKELVEKKLNKKCEYICWPWGSVDKKLMRLAKEAGYKAGIGMHGGANIIFTNAMNIHRFNGAQKDLISFQRKLYKYSNTFFALYQNKKLDNLFINNRNFA